MNENDIKSLKWQDKDKRFSLGNSLYLRLKKTKRIYVVRKKSNGKNQVITLGNTETISLKQAKHQASLLSMQLFYNRNGK